VEAIIKKMATKIFRIDSQWHKKEQYPFLEIENGKVFEIDKIEFYEAYISPDYKKILKGKK